MADCPQLAAIAHERDGGELGAHQDKFQRQIEKAALTGELLILVAELHGQILGFARAGSHEWKTDEDRGVPNGWCLLGIVVRPEFRSHGVARQLTRKRLEWLSECGDTAYYFADSGNRAS